MYITDTESLQKKAIFFENYKAQFITSAVDYNAYSIIMVKAIIGEILRKR